jgi:hypothetical protein
MNIKILPIATDDLLNGYHFYEHQEKGIGNYFLSSIYSDIESLLIYHRLLQNAFLLLFIIKLTIKI